MTSLREEILQKWDFGDFDDYGEVLDMIFTTLKERIEGERKKNGGDEKVMSATGFPEAVDYGFNSAIDTITRLLE